MKSSYSRSEFAPKLRYLFLELTQQCNLFCSHCGSSCGSHKREELTKDEWCEFIRYISAHFSPQELMFCITGGEPLLRKDFYDIVNYINAKGFSWGMTTNGTLIKEKDIHLLLKAGMKTVSISIDGLENTHDKFRNVVGCFQDSMSAFRMLNQASNLQCVQITTVVGKHNIDELEQLYTYFQNAGVKDWRIASIDPIGRAKEKSDLLLSADDYKTLLSFISRIRAEKKIHVQYGCSHYVPEEWGYDLRDGEYGCRAGISIASVLSNGDIFSCIDIERSPDLIQGNILTDDFCQIWLEKFEIFRNQTRSLSSEECAICDKRRFCLGDAAHTWDYEKKVPRICLYHMLEQSHIEGRECNSNSEKKKDYLCGLINNSSDDWDPYDDILFQALYAPPSVLYASPSEEDFEN